MKENLKLEKRYIIMYNKGYENKYLSSKDDHYINYHNQYFSYKINNSRTYKSLKNAYNRILKIPEEYLKYINVVEVQFKLNKRKYDANKFIKTDNVFTHRDISLIMKIQKLKSK